MTFSLQKKDRKEDMGQCLTKVDKNKDGRISPEELAVAVVAGLREAGALAVKAADVAEKVQENLIEK